MNVTAGKNSLVNESAAKEKIRRHRFVFLSGKGLTLCCSKMECSILFRSQIRKVFDHVSSFKLTISPPEIEGITYYLQKLALLDILQR